MRFFDSHTHLDSPRFAPDRSDVIARALNRGVAHMVTCASDLSTSHETIALAQTYQGVYAAVGIHAHEARSAAAAELHEQAPWEPNGSAFGALAELASLSEVVALGEIGLDYHYDFSPRVAQRVVLERQLHLACELDLPVVLHNRESDEDLQRLVDAAPSGLRGVLHCFLSDRSMAEWALSRGLYIGIGGPITFSSASHLPGVVRQIPLDRLLIETDCPYLAPSPKRGRRNEPAFVPYVAEKLAEVLGVSLPEVAGRTTENACRLFGVG